MNTSIFPGVSNSGDPGTHGLNQTRYTVMSYVDGKPNNTDDVGNIIGPMAFDIAAIQELYGANTTYNSGNDTYLLTDTGAWSSIWDTGGTDIIRYDGANDVRIDLRPAKLDESADAGGYFSRVAPSTGATGGYTIAGDYTNAIADQNSVSGVIIENAQGGSGNDLLIGNGVANTLTGGLGNDRLIGRRGADVLNGGDGNDVLIGGQDNDTLIGGLGNDLHYVDNAGDVVQEATGEGTADRVATNTNYALTAGAEVELFTTTVVAGTTNLELTGNEFAQTIIGNAGNNRIADGAGAGADVLRGLGGDDFYVVYNSGTMIEEKSSDGANDRVAAGVDYTLANGVFVELLTTTSTGATIGIDLTGNGSAQTIVGNAANNTIADGGGAAANGDILKGLAGSDFYIVRNEGTVVQELVGQGAFDRVAVSKSYALAAGAEIESLRTTSLTGTSILSLTGNEFGQQIIGNAGANTLTGLGGNDTFVMASALGGGNIDTITDYNVADDQFELVQTIFNGIAATGALSADAFVANATGNAEDATDRIIYNSGTGGVFYDPDGTGGTAATQFATVAAGLGITAADFNVT